MTTTPVTAGAWFRVQSAVVGRIADVGPLGLAVYIVLAKHADLEGVCWPSVRSIAALCGSTDRGVRKAVERLVRSGMIAKETRADQRGGTASNRYRVLPLHPQEPAERLDGGGTQSPSPPEPGAPRGRNGEQGAPRNGEHHELDPSLNYTHGTKGRRRPAWEEGGEVEIPESLRSERFDVAWCEWLQYRTQRRLSRAPMTLSRQLSMLARLGIDGAVAAIDRSITSGWQGLFEEKGSKNGNGKWDPVAAGRYRP